MEPIIDPRGYTVAELCEIIKICDEELQARADDHLLLADAMEAELEEYCAGR